MECKIICMSVLASDILAAAKIGTVHSVYRKTINLEFSGRLLALQTKESPLSPISLIIDMDESSMQALGVTSGEEVLISGSYITVGTLRFSFDTAKIVNLFCSSSLTDEEQETLRTNIKNVVFSSHTGGFDSIFHTYNNQKCPLPTLILEGARHYMSDAYEFLTQGDDKNAATTLSRLIGLGTGLTPSGDDFLCGALAGIILSGLSDSDFAKYLKEEIKNHLSDTNDISRAFLLCALKGQFSLAVNTLCKIPSSGQIYSSFKKIGHSSGIDTLCGIFFILNVKNGQV